MKADVLYIPVSLIRRPAQPRKAFRLSPTEELVKLPNEREWRLIATRKVDDEYDRDGNLPTRWVQVATLSSDKAAALMQEVRDARAARRTSTTHQRRAA